MHTNIFITDYRSQHALFNHTCWCILELTNKGQYG